jgi:hypothetical protein
VPSNPASATATNITWRTPNIYQMIQAAGETVVGQGVFIVYAKNINWTLTYLNVSPGQKIWIDTQAVGSWNIKPWAGIPSTDANGVSNPSTYGATGPDGAPYSAPGQPMGCLAGKIASSTPFFLGDDKYNYPPVGSGAFSMICNDWASALNYNDNTGYQYVRVIVVE